MKKSNTVFHCQELANGWFAQWYDDGSTEFVDPGCPSVDDPNTACMLTFRLPLNIPNNEHAEGIAQALEQAFQAGQLDGARTLRNQFRTLLSL